MTMQLHIVTGIGPRCGTSATVRRIADEYGVEPFGQKFPWWCVPEENPEGYWEGIIERGDVAVLAQQTGVVVAKVWPGMLDWIEAEVFIGKVSSLTVCRRNDREAQLDATLRVQAKEHAAGISFPGVPTTRAEWAKWIDTSARLVDDFAAGMSVFSPVFYQTLEEMASWQR